MCWPRVGEANALFSVYSTLCRWTTTSNFINAVKRQRNLGLSLFVIMHGLLATRRSVRVDYSGFHAFIIDVILETVQYIFATFNRKEGWNKYMKLTWLWLMQGHINTTENCSVNKTGDVGSTPHSWKFNLLIDKIESLKHRKIELINLIQ
jgi:hypothetical protein